MEGLWVIASLIFLLWLFILWIGNPNMAKKAMETQKFKCQACGCKFILTEGTKKHTAKRIRKCSVSGCPQKDFGLALVKGKAGVKELEIPVLLDKKAATPIKNDRIDKMWVEHVTPPEVDEVQSGRMKYAPKGAAASAP